MRRVDNTVNTGQLAKNNERVTNNNGQVRDFKGTARYFKDQPYLTNIYLSECDLSTWNNLYYTRQVVVKLRYASDRECS